MGPWIPWEFMLVTANRDHIYQKCFGTKILLEELERDDKNSLVNSESGNEGEVSSVMVRKSLLLNGIASGPFPTGHGARPKCNVRLNALSIPGLDLYSAT